MSTHNRPNKNTAHALNQKVIAAVTKYFAKVKTMTLAGTTYTPASLKAVLQGEIDANRSLDDVRAQCKQQVASTLTARAKARAARKALKAYVLGSYGADAVQMLEDFGMTKSASTPTVEVKAQAVAKAQATREARHTMGKKQKQSIKGVLPPAKADTQSQGGAANTPSQTEPAPQPAPSTTPKS